MKKFLGTKFVLALLFAVAGVVGFFTMSGVGLVDLTGLAGVVLGAYGAANVAQKIGGKSGKQDSEH